MYALMVFIVNIYAFYKKRIILSMNWCIKNISARGGIQQTKKVGQLYQIKSIF